MKLDLKFNATYGNLSRGLADAIKAALAGQQISVGERLPSNREIADRAKVSQVTARMAIDRLCKEGVLEARPGVGTFVKEQPGRIAAPGPSDVTRIGLVLSPWDDESDISWDRMKVFSEIMMAVNSDSRQLLVFPYSRWLEHARSGNPEAIITENHLDMLIWFHAAFLECAFISRLQQQCFRQLIFFRRQFGLTVPAVLHDETDMVRQLVEHLSDEEVQNAIIITGHPNLSPYIERVETLREEFRLRGTEINAERLIILPESAYPDWSCDVIANLMKRHQAKVLIDFIGYSKIVCQLFQKQKFQAKVISVAPLPEGFADKTFIYTYYEPCYTYSLGKIIRDFIHGRYDFKDVLLKYRRIES